MQIESHIPRFARSAYRRLRSTLKNWTLGHSNKDVFSTIYRQNLWGSSDGGTSFYSGSGSYDPSVPQYVEFLLDFIRSSGVSKVLEIGCGDFSIACQYAKSLDEYVGVDVVEDVISENRKRFGTDSIRFIHADAARDPLPPADLCLIRQVFQHLSNRDISRVLDKLKSCRYVLVTEHLPAPDKLRRKNIDKVAGRDTRVDFGSGVYLEAPPFNIPTTTVLETVIANYRESADERLRTVLIKN